MENVVNLIDVCILKMQEHESSYLQFHQRHKYILHVYKTILISIIHKPDDKKNRHSIPLHISEKQILDAINYSDLFKITFNESKSGNKSFDIEWDNNDLFYTHVLNRSLNWNYFYNTLNDGIEELQQELTCMI